MKIVVTGHSGYIGKYLIGHLTADGYDVYGTARHTSKDLKTMFLDLQNPDSFEYQRINENDLILHLASVSSPDICKSQYEYAWQVNVTGTLSFLNNCAERNAKIIFFSSDTVYGDKEACFDEDSLCSPVGEYGKMKYAVEKVVKDITTVKIFRLSYVFSKHDKFTRYLSDCGNYNKTAEIFHPLYRNMVYIRDVLDAVSQLCLKWDFFSNTVFNICGEELLSRKDLAGLFKKTVCDNLKIAVVEPEISFFNARPKSICTISKYLPALLGRRPTAISNAMAIEFNV